MEKLLSLIKLNLKAKKRIHRHKVVLGQKQVDKSERWDGSQSASSQKQM